MTTTIPAYTFGGITRPALILDDTGHIVLFGDAATFAATYGLKALYAGVPPGTRFTNLAVRMIAQIVHAGTDRSSPALVGRGLTPMAIRWLVGAAVLAALFAFLARLAAAQHNCSICMAACREN